MESNRLSSHTNVKWIVLVTDQIIDELIYRTKNTKMMLIMITNLTIHNHKAHILVCNQELSFATLMRQNYSVESYCDMEQLSFRRATLNLEKTLIMISQYTCK